MPGVSPVAQVLEPKGQPQTSQPSATVTYVITVHGIGEQRLNETVLPVVSRFAEARRRSASKAKRNVMTLGMATGQTGWYDTVTVLDDLKDIPNPLWMQFDHLPRVPAKDPLNVPFLGLPQKATKDNLCFVDAHWADLLNTDFDRAGMGVDHWIESVIARMEEKDQYVKSTQTQQTTKWRNIPSGWASSIPPAVMQVLYTLEQSIDFAHRFLTIRNKELDDLVFAKYLGDCQIYTEYLQCRGRAVRRFHNLMARLHEQHHEKFGNAPAEYVIIAHSLGSVLALDALMYAQAKAELRLASPRDDRYKEINSYPLYGYRPWKGDASAHAPMDKLPSVDWLRSVTSFVTLGSPIDKFISIWWYNYRYLFQVDQWQAGVPEKKIKHFNYCDEQDPVGQHLDCLFETPAFQRFFSQEDDRVFNRYVVPLAAHLGYWQDSDLFAWILHETVDADAKTTVEEPKWYKRSVYIRVLLISYFLVPLIVAGADVIALNWALTAPSWLHSVVGGIAFVFTCWMGRKVINLFVYWRQVLRTKKMITNTEGSK